MNTTNYPNKYIGCGDYFGKNSPNDLFNKDLVKILRKYNVSLEDFEEISRIVSSIFDKGYHNGRNDTDMEHSEEDL